MKQNNYYSLIAAACFAVLITLTASFAVNAQQGRYANTYSRSDINGFISSLENSSDAFSRDFKNAGGSSSGERRIVDNFENAVDRLRRRFDSGDNWWQSRNEVQAIMPQAQQVNILMNQQRYERALERQWRDLRRDINKLADTYDLPGVAGGGWNGGGSGYPGNGGGWNGNGQISAPPSWAVGTFYATNGSGISMSIDSSGRITVINEGQTYYGRYYRGQMYLNNDVSTVSRAGNGIRTYNKNIGQTTDYSRNFNGGGNGYPGNSGGYPGNGGPTSNPPSWARGTFYSTGNAGISLSINSDGRVIVNNNGETFYGTYYNGEIRLNNDVSTVSQRNNGISTYNRNTGRTTIYRRQ